MHVNWSRLSAARKADMKQEPYWISRPACEAVRIWVWSYGICGT